MLVRLPYTLLWLFALPLILVRLVWRARRQPGYLKHVGERFARYRKRAPCEVIWVHAVSVGETRAAEPLVRALLERYPGHSVLLTHMTPTGRATSKALFGNDPRVLRAYLPYDLSPLCARFLRHFRPALGIIMETELWPNLLAVCARQGVPVLLANARLSVRSARRYARWPALTRATLGALSALGAQTGADAERLRALGARGVEITGNVKFDMTPSPALLELGERFRARAGERPLILAASTRDGEEAPLLDEFLRMAPDDAVLLLVPRHPQRADAVAALAAGRGVRLQRRSEDGALAADTRIWLGDSMGEMFAWYATADVALIGGSWLPFGGQNLIEACMVGTPVIFGPHTFNFALAATQAVEAGAALRCENAETGMRAAVDLLGDEARRRAMGAAGRAYAAAHRGATARTLELADRLLSPPRPAGH